jgi:GH24 family phage-related lysozyme (muramidase)
MSSPTVQNINTAGLNEEQKNGLSILEQLSVDDLNQIKAALKLSGPGVIGPQTLDAFVASAGTLGFDLTNAGVNTFKDDNNLGNSGPLAGVIGPQTATFYANQILSQLQSAQTSQTSKINQAGLQIVKQSEGYAQLIPGTTSVRAYPDPGTGGDPWTIGYGHTGPDVFPGVVFTQAQAEAALLSDLSSAESDVSSAVTVSLNANEFSALVSFTFNVGGPQLRSSTLLRLLNQGQRQAAADQFMKWVNGGNGPLPGLVTRRTAERALFLKPV